MKRIPLTQGQFAIVDDEDFDWLNQWKWCAKYASGQRRPYAFRRESGRGIYMHRLVAQTADGEFTDHRNLCTLDNRRCNLRRVTHQQNMQNKLCVGGKSKFKGVSRSHKRLSRPWRARIYCNGVEHRLGRFPTELQAAIAYDEAARRLHGEFARTNFGPNSIYGQLPEVLSA